MTTNFPTSVDAFTNPTSNDTLDNPPHDQQHADINDAMEAVQTALLDGSPLKIDDANNRVGIGTASPAGTLDVNGKIHLAGGADRYIEHRSGNNDILYHSNSGNFYRQDIANSSHQFFTGNTERLAIDSSGNVNINSGSFSIGGTAVGTWTSWTPSIYAQTGSIGGYSSSGHYARINDVVIIEFSIGITSIGTAGGACFLTPPVAVTANTKGGAKGSIAEYSVAGFQGVVFYDLSGSDFPILAYNWTTPFRNGGTIGGFAVYEV